MASFDEIAARLRGTSVPLIGSARATTLDAALARVARAERELQDARAEARRLGRAAGKKLSSLFEDSIFVKRSSAEAWSDEARSEGFERACGYFERALRPQSEKERDPFYRLAAGLVRRGLGHLNPPTGDARINAMSEVDQIQQRILKSRETDFSNQMPGAPKEPGKLADAILAAGKRARSPTDADPPREMNALSAAIVAAGKKRRQEDE